MNATIYFLDPADRKEKVGGHLLLSPSGQPVFMKRITNAKTQFMYKFKTYGIEKVVVDVLSGVAKQIIIDVPEKREAWSVSVVRFLEKAERDQHPPYGIQLFLPPEYWTIKTY